MRYRMLVAAVTLPLGFLIGPNEELVARAAPFLAVSAAVAALSLAYLVGLRWGARPRLQMAVQVALDVLLVTWIAAVTGGRHSQFVLFYVLVILYSGVLFAARGGIATAAGAAGAYLLLPWLAGGGPGSLEARAPEDPTWPLASGLFLAVGLLGGYLGWRVRRTSQSLERAAREVERARFDTERILACMSSGVLTLAMDGTVLHVNPAAAEVLGIPEQELRGWRFQEVLGTGQGELLRRLDGTIRGGAPLHRVEIHVVGRDGQRRPLGLSTSLLHDGHGNRRGVIAVFADLTEFKAVEERARRSETLAAIGELSAGIAHEIRNAVVPMAGSVEILRSELQLTGESERLLELVSRECDRLNRFVSELLDYVRESEVHREPVAIEDLVRDVVELCRQHPQAGEIEFEIVREGPPHRVQADREQLKGAFLNLIQNAVEALEGRGTVRIRIESLGDRVAVTFQDGGPGIPAKHLERITEPFFTTKRGGTGLGLSTAARVFERHGAVLEVSSQEGLGTEVSVLMPHDAEERVAA